MGLSQEVRSAINQAVESNRVCIFMKGTPDQPMCGFSKAVVEILRVQGVQNMGAVDVLENESVRSGIKEYSDWPTVPQVFVDGEFVGGCDVIVDMFRKRELEKMLLEKGIIDQPGEDSVQG